MKKTILVCGLIAGLIAASFFIGTMLIGYKVDEMFENGMIYGYTLMILAFSLIFVGTKITRDKYNNGVISFGKAFLTGFYISLIASTVYVIVWLIDYHFFIPDFVEKYSQYTLNKLQASGATATAIATQKAELEQFKQLYSNLFFTALVTYAEILPLGILVSLVSAFSLKRKIKKDVVV